MRKLILLSALLLTGCVHTLPRDLSRALNETKKIQYKRDEIGEDYWQTVEETEKRRTGDCEDMAIYLKYLLAKRNIPSEFCVGRQFENSLPHAWVQAERKGITYVLDPASKRWEVKTSGRYLRGFKLE